MLYGFSYFFTYPYLKKKFSKTFEKHDQLPLLYFLSGMFSEYLGLLIYFPFETVKVRMQAKHTKYKY